MMWPAIVRTSLPWFGFHWKCSPRITPASDWLSFDCLNSTPWKQAASACEKKSLLRKVSVK